MEFGRLADTDLSTVDLSLPPESVENAKILAQANAKRQEIFIGCAKWGRKDWVGKIYPPKTKEADFLSLYASHFNCIELNATFYKIPRKAQTKIWSEKVGEDFLFCPKFSQSITHIRRLKNAEEVTERFLDGVSGFGKNLGPLFLMPHPQMGPKSTEVMQAFIQSLPKDLDVFVELRHSEWYSDSLAFDSFNKFLETQRTGTVITDAAGRRDCVHMRLTTPQAFIRFVGNGLHPTDYTRVDAWVERIAMWLEAGIERIYFFMHQHEELHSPELCRYLIRQLNARCKTNIKEPVFVVT